MDASKRIARDLVQLLGDDTASTVVFALQARMVSLVELAEAAPDVYGTHTAAALGLSREILGNEGARQIVLIAVNQPSAETLETGEISFNYPPVPSTWKKTLAEAKRCAESGMVLRCITVAADAETVRAHTDLATVTGGDTVVVRDIEATVPDLERYTRPLGS